MSLKNLEMRFNKWIVHGERKPCWIGRDSFKLANMLSLHFTGHGGWEDKANRWIEHNQRLLGEHVILRVFSETGGWSGHPMFGAAPADQGIWDIEHLRDLSEKGRRITELTPLNKRIVEWLLKASHETGVCFEYVVDATLKHIEGLTTPMTGHAIRQTALYMRELQQDKYPNAVILMEARNELFAHNRMKTTLRQANMWATRFYRWKDEEGNLAIRRNSPGDEYFPEQWPEGYIILDQTDKDLFPFDVGTEAGKYQMGCIHPDRAPDDRKWWELPTTMEQLRTDCRGAPLGFNESKTYCDAEDKDRCLAWYGGAWKVTFDLDKYLEWFGACTTKGGVDYYIIHDEKGMQCDVDWPRKVTRLEAALGGAEPPPPPPPPPPPGVDYRPIIDRAYREILGRPGEQAGLNHKNEKMRDGWTEAEIREEMIRSEEYRKKHT